MKIVVGIGVAVIAPMVVMAAQVAAPSKTSSIKASPTVVKQLTLQSKQYMSQGDRKKAIETLNQALESSPSKQARRELQNKRVLFLEQFFNSESFQKYEASKVLYELDRSDECVRELGSVTEQDKDNLKVMHLKARCHMMLKQHDSASSLYKTILNYDSGDFQAVFGLAEIAVHEKKAAEGLALLQQVKPQASDDIEQYAILKSQLLEQSGKLQDAIEVLRLDQEAHLDHVQVLYELGMLYSRSKGNDWQARKMLSLFVTRCKRMKEEELKSRGFDAKLVQAQKMISTLDQRLGV